MKTETHRGENTMWRWRQRLERSIYEPRNTKDHWQLPEAGRKAWNEFSRAFGEGNALSTP